MTQGNDPNNNAQGASISSTVTVTTTTSGSGPTQFPSPAGSPGRSATDTIAALTVALLAVVIVLTLVLVCRALRKRRRARRGTELNQIPTISTGIMGTGVAAYNNQSQQIPVAGHISWEPVDGDESATGAQSQAETS